jgi:hypothetical protein
MYLVVLKMNTVWVRTESSRVQSDSPSRGSESIAYFQWPPRQCVHTSLAESRVFDAACSIFVSQTLVIGRDGWYLEEEMVVEKLILVTDHEAIFDASRSEHRNRH